MIKDKIKEYQRKSWKLKRDNILRRDNYTCCRCGRKQADGAILNVHHLVYFKKTKIYDYPDGVLETLCTTCHLEEHGKIMPQSGWIYEDWDDTEEYGAEQCDLCGQDLRYVYILYHPNWGFIRVGCECADKLTNNDNVKLRNIEIEKRAKRIKTFVDSPKWKHHKNGYFFEHQDDKIQIWENAHCNYVLVHHSISFNESGYRYPTKNTLTGFKTLNEAKLHAYELFHPRSPKRKIEDDDILLLPKNPIQRVEMLKNLIYECIETEKKIIKPAYITPSKTITAAAISCSNITKNKHDKSWDYDFVVSHIGKDKKTHQFYIKFILEEDLSTQQCIKIKEDGVNYIKVNCDFLKNIDSITLNNIHYYLYNTISYSRYQWVSIPAYDNYFKRQT